MPAEARQAIDRRHWLPITHVAEITGESERTWRNRAVRLAARGLAAQLPPPSNQGKPIWWFDPTVDSRLTSSAEQARDDRQIQALSGQYPAHLIERAAKKLQYLRLYWRHCGQTDKRSAAREVAKQAKACEGEAFPISWRTIQRWDAEYQEHGFDGLLDRYRYGDRSSDPNRRHPEAIEFFYTLFHTQQRLSVRMCHDIVLRESQRRGWCWPQSLSATYGWLREHDDREKTLLLRWGKTRYQQQVMPYIEQDYAAVAPGEQFVCDHHQAKAFVLYKGKPIRPWLTAVLDTRSRVLTGWHIGPAPHSDAILQSLRMAFVNWGVPLRVKIDNGRDYTAQVFSGITKNLESTEFRPTSCPSFWRSAW